MFWQESSDSSIGVFESAFLPGCVRVAEESFAFKRVQFLMVCELASIIERGGFSGDFWEQFES